MIEIKFSVSSIDDTFSEFDLGHVEIQIDNKIISSKNKNPDQSMMIWIAISDLLGCVKCLLQKTTQNMHFVGVDSSFQMTLKRDKSSCIIGYCNTQYKCDLFLFAKRLYESADQFYREYKMKIKENKGVLDDLENSLDNFSKELNIIIE